MDDTLKILLTLEGSRLRHYIDHKRLLQSTVFEEVFNDVIANYKKFGDTTILTRLLGAFDGSKLKAVLLSSICKATGLRGKMHESEVTFFKSVSTGDENFELKESLAKPSEKASRAKLKRRKHSPQSAKGPKYPKLAGKPFDPYAPRGKTAEQLETPKKHWQKKTTDKRGEVEAKAGDDKHRPWHGKNADKAMGRGTSKYGEEKRAPARGKGFSPRPAAGKPPRKGPPKPRFK